MVAAMMSAPNQRPLWDAWHEPSHSPDAEPVHREFIDAFLAELPPDADPLLELGCGQGHDALYVAGRGHCVYALDFSPVAIEQATRNLRAYPGLDVDLLQHDIAEALPFADGAFGGIFSYLSLHYFDDSTTRSVFREIHRVARPGGILAFCVKSVRDPLFGLGTLLGPDMYSLNGHVRHFFEPQYATGLVDGWELVHIEEKRGRYLDSATRSVLLQVIARKPAGEG
ncbi:methyltransferase domain-containing protein [Microbispora hainanensis]|uniref:class I SAM-dependent methyltransferase n=1 Tax=Microbispora hainanensis TaxID=568844 RepID=UPI0033C41059